MLCQNSVYKWLCIGLKRKCLFPFLRKCENHAKMVRFSRNFATNFARKKPIFAKIFAKISYIFRENFCENEKSRFSRKISRKFRIFSRKFSRKRKNPIFAKIFAKVPRYCKSLNTNTQIYSKLICLSEQQRHLKHHITGSKGRGTL
jgi:hypothetical protein